MKARRKIWKRAGEVRQKGLMRPHRKALWWVHESIFAAPVSASERNAPPTQVRKKRRLKLHRPTSEDSWIFIPSAMRDRELSSFKMTARLRHLLAFQNFRVLDHLHGLVYEDILQWRFCGRKTLAELQTLVKKVRSKRSVY